MPEAPGASLSEDPPPSARRILWLLGGLALALRLFDLGRRELWVDEAFTWHFATLLGELELDEPISLEPTPPLYYGLIGLLLRLFGDSDLLLRLPSALAGAVSAPLLAMLGERLGWRRAGLLGGLLLACHPLHLFLSREARVYPLLLMLVLLLAIALWRALGEGAPAQAWLTVGGLLTLVFYSHLFGLFAGAATALLVVLLARDRAGRIRGLAAVGAALLLFAPYLLAALPALSESGASWSQEFFEDALPAEGGLPRIYEGQLIGARYHLLQRELALPATPPLLRWPAVAAQSLLLLAAFALLGRRPEERRALIFVTAFYLLPFVLPWLLGNAAGRVFFQPGRHDFAALGPLCLLIAAGAEALHRRWRALAYLLLLPMVAGGLFRLAWIHLLPDAGRAQERGAFLAAAAAPGDLAVSFGIEKLLGERYTRLAGSQLEFVSFPAETDRHPGYADPRPLLRKLPELAAEARAQIAGREGGGRLITLERWTPGEKPPPGGELDALYLRALREAGWQVEQHRQDLLVRIWRAP